MFNPLSYFKSAPPFTVWHSHPGEKTRVLVTAGVDGDEYDGINAAKTLIATYQGNIPITVIPVVNLAGYQAGTSHNPLDGKYPKYIFPGNRWGSSSSRLIYQVAQYTKGIDLWVDLHGGATNEHLRPFVWAQATHHNSLIDTRTKHFLSHLPATTLYTEKNTLPFAKVNASYLLFESGELGQATSANTKRHLKWLNLILDNLDNPSSKKFTPTHTTINYSQNLDSIPQNYLWYSDRLTAIGS